MLKILMILGVCAISVIAIFAVLVVYACCVVHGKSEEMANKIEFSSDKDELSNLEKETVDKLVKLYKEDKAR